MPTRTPCAAAGALGSTLEMITVPRVVSTSPTPSGPDSTVNVVSAAASAAASALAAGADVLVYEAMRFERIRQRPPHLQFILDYHADTMRIGAQAAELGVPTLVLTHLIPPPESDDDVQAFVDDIRTAGYAGELVVAEDL